MATRNAPHLRLLRFAAAFVLAASAFGAGARAQSGRPAASPTPTPGASTTAAPTSGVSAREEAYRLVYVGGWEGPLRPDGGEEADSVRHSRMNDFIARLNEAGARGYRLLHVVNGWLPFAVVELDGAQHEYGWFETAVVGRSAGDVGRVYTRFFNTYRKQTAGGFRLAEHFVTQRACALFSTGIFRVEERCIFKDLYLLERRKGVERPRQAQMAFVEPGTRPERPGDELTARAREGLAEGLRPAYAFSRFALLLEEPWAPTPDGPRGADDFRVVARSGGGGGDFERAVNELARQGYRVHLSNNGVAVMRRGGADTAPAEYLWLDAKEKSFARRLAAAQEAGAVYRMTSLDGEGDEARLVFERAPAADGRRRDYKVFRIELSFEEYAAEGKVKTFFSPQTLESLREVARLVKEGYVVRDLFWADAAHMLLERAPGQAR